MVLYNVLRRFRADLSHLMPRAFGRHQNFKVASGDIDLALLPNTLSDFQMIAKMNTSTSRNKRETFSMKRIDLFLSSVFFSFPSPHIHNLYSSAPIFFLHLCGAQHCQSTFLLLHYLHLAQLSIIYNNFSLQFRIVSFFSVNAQSQVCNFVATLSRRRQVVLSAYINHSKYSQSRGWC